MSRFHSRHSIVWVLTTFFIFFMTASSVFAQHGSEGRVNVTVVDPSGAVVPKASLTLTDFATNQQRTAQTSDSGTYTFVNLSIGNYSLTVVQSGFAEQKVDVVVQASKTTDVQLKLAVGTQAQTVQVEGVAPLLELTTNAIGQVIDPRQIETLPITGRDLTQLSRLTAGYNGAWNGLPTYAQGNNIDGVVGSPSRMKFGGNAQASVSPRLENMEEMVIQTDAMDTNQGFGQAAMQIGFVTRRGSNVFHGRAYEDFRNDWLNASSWSNNARGLKRSHFIRNEFGGSVGGPILKDKLFFFASLSAFRQPGSVSTFNTVLTPAAQAGNFTYRDSAGVSHTVNVLQVVGGYPGASLPSTVNSAIAAQLAKINNSLSNGTVTGTADPIVNSINFQIPSPTNNIYPTLRLDYNATRKIRMNLALNRSMSESPVASLPYFPGSDFEKTKAGNKSDAVTAGYGLNWTISPTLINELKVGWNYNATFFAYNSPKAYYQNPFTWGWPIVGVNNLSGSGQDYYRPINTYYPVWNVSDTLSWQKGAHNFTFGYSFVREQDHYWNGPEGIGGIGFGLVQGDAALAALTNTGSYVPLPGASTTQQTEAQQLYALLAGRISGVTGLYAFNTKTQNYLQGVSAYPLNELAKAWGLFAQDSWRLRPNFTVNYGLRWDFTGDDYDLTKEYHNADLSSVYGPTAPGDLFKPGVLNGNLSPTLTSRAHAYNSWNVSPQPSLGFAWNPSHEGGILGALIGKDATVVRTGFALRRFTMPYQYVWNYASNCGSFYYQTFSLTPSSVPGTGNFAPGGLALGQTLPPYAITPASFQKTAPEAQFTFTAGPGGSCGVNVTGFKPNLAQPYVESWNFGIQRRLGSSRVLEIRYNGNRTLKEWLALNTNEVNIFENGFLPEFINAQNNLRVNGGNSFANSNPAAGTVPLPNMTAAFTGSTTGSQTNSQFRDSTLINWLNTGQVGAFAARLTTATGAVPYFCNLVGAAAFSPCVTNARYSGAGAGFPINFLQANPYAARNGNNVGNTALMTDAGYSSYHALQVDFRQQPWHGLQFDANYTWSKTLGTLAGGSGNDWLGNYTAFSLRNLRASYMPGSFDVHHVVHINASADLPFGRGKRWANRSGVIDRIVGGWNVGTISSIQSGFPFRVVGGYSTYNQTADSGVALLNGLTRQKLQDSVGVYRIPGATFVSLIDPKYLAVSGNTVSGANTNYMVANTTPGTFNAPLILYGPHGFYQDLMVTKSVPITERIRFNLQSAFLNAWNHPVFGNSASPVGGNVRSNGWATLGGGNGGTGNCFAACGGSTVNGFGRQIELRANIIF